MVTSLFTKEDLVVLPGLYATETVEMQAKMAWVRLGHTRSSWVWYVIEFDGEDTCFGLVEGFATEFGYFTLSELYGLDGEHGHVVRDEAFKACSVGELLR